MVVAIVAVAVPSLDDDDDYDDDGYLIFTELLLNTKHWVLHFTHIVPFNPHCNYRNRYQHF